MIKIFALIFAVILTRSTFAVYVTEVDGVKWYYEFTGVSQEANIRYEAELVNYNSTTSQYVGDVTVPSIVDGDTKIVSIGRSVFLKCKDITSVYLPASLIKIGSSAFDCCSSLHSVDLPESLETIEDYAFDACTALETIKIPKKVSSIGVGVFNFCENLKEIQIDSRNSFFRLTPEGDVVRNVDSALVVTLPKDDLTIPGDVRIISGRVLADRERLKNLSIDDGVEQIGDEAFSSASLLQNVEIPKSIKTVGWGAFSLCVSIGELRFKDGLVSIGVRAFSGCSKLESIELPKSLEGIGNYAFDGCDALRTVYVDTGDGTRIKELMRGKGVDVDSLEFVESTLPDGGPYKETVDGVEYKFYIEDGEAKLNGGAPFPAVPRTTSGSIVIPSILGGCPLTTLCACAFGWCDLLSSVTIPEGVTTIEGDAFSGCSSLTSVTIPNSVTTIGYGAFGYCSSLTSVTIPDSVTTIDGYMFGGCASLQEIEVEPANAAYCSIDGILYTKDIRTLVECPGAKTSVTIPESVTKIDNYAFEGCSSLTSVTIPNSVTTIGWSAFYGCSSLTSVTIPESVTKIDNYAFNYCSSLKTVFVDDGDADRVRELMRDKCVDVAGLSFVEVLPDGGPYTKSVDGVEWTFTISNGKATIKSSENSAAIPTSTVGALDIPAILGGCPVKAIGRYSFCNCSSLTSVTIPEGVTSIGTDAFYGCESLSSVTIPEGVTTIGLEAFCRCSSLSSVTIPESVTTIGGGAFLGTPFYENQPDGFVVFAKGCLWRYKGECPPEITIPDHVTTIGESAFQNCSSLTKVTIPESVTAIGAGAFRGCSSLMSVEIPEKVSTIETCTFYGCNALKFVIIPEDVTAIGMYAFNGCNALKTVYVNEGSTDRIKDLMRDKGVDADALTFVEAMYSLKVDKEGCLTGYEGKLPSELVVPEDVKSIGQEAFKDCTAITSIKIPNSVTSIGKRAFYGCENLETVVLPSNKINIGSQAFFGVPWYENAIVEYASGAPQAVANTVVVTNVVVHYVVNSIQPEFARPVSGDTGFVNVIAEVNGNNVAVPETWAESYPKFTATFGTDFTKALTKKTGKIAADGREMLVWEDYVAGTDPTDSNDKFTATMTMVDGKPVISWTPELDPERAAMRKYTTYGKAKLTDNEWIVVPEGCASDYNFFKVTVEMK